jgi:hypothetical protein
MRKVLALAIAACMFGACNPSNSNPGESGAVNDGTKAIDSNGGLADTPYRVNANLRKTDTSKMEDRVDLSKRDTFNH